MTRQIICVQPGSRVQQVRPVYWPEHQDRRLLRAAERQVMDFCVTLTTQHTCALNGPSGRPGSRPAGERTRRSHAVHTPLTRRSTSSHSGRAQVGGVEQ